MYSFTKHEFCVKWQQIIATPDFKQFLSEMGTLHEPPLEEYKDTDWTQATPETFLKMFWPRGSERGNIHGEEALFFIEYCLAEEPKLIIEIGAMHGVSTRLLGALAKRVKGKLVSIDAGMVSTVEPNLKLLNLSDTVTLVKEWSPWITYKIDKEIDLLFIDGDHSLMSVIVDYHYFNFFLKKNGVVAFDNMDMAPCQKALEIIKQRDPLTQIADPGVVIALRKTSEAGEKYFQLLSCGTDRNLLRSL